MDDEKQKQKQISTQWSMALKGYLNHQVRAFGVQAPTVLAAKPLRRFLHLSPRLCNHPITPIKQTAFTNLHRRNHEAIEAHLWTAP
jgi:hypothetical protein